MYSIALVFVAVASQNEEGARDDESDEQETNKVRFAVTVAIAAVYLNVN